MKFELFAHVHTFQWVFLVNILNKFNIVVSFQNLENRIEWGVQNGPILFIQN